ncbi:DUF5107 domain-containing protein [uncultured Chitinophaga sp.]|uniref:DUF5107 domain-containing protein n=1 Tax=uncultured Chitinophaga sp. TaxID=339340 RepID=UPI0025E7D42F|nr:DUF5107 domain-containing protein [uncultured Chitinophaga sp.]
MNIPVKVWVEEVIIPTYPAGKPDKNPMFLEKRVYQGSSGVVYPHPVVDKISDEKTDQSYTAVYLENEYVKIMVLPQLGGRIQMAYDKVKQRHFVYYNQVIKPALVGLTGPWISGGIEFNWPQHHRPSTFEAVDFTIKEHADGSATCWVNEVELMFRTKGMAAFTLHPGKAFLEIKGMLYNRTPFPQTFLWWANPAVKVNDGYQSVFPPDVYAVFDHGRRDVSSFPIAKGTYYKVDYSPGTDISRYKNIPVPTSYMAVASKYNFIGGYEHDTGGGLLHVANHHISPGKKQWTWGHGDFGQAWDRNLTDEDGPYIELMTGVFTDNQPDFSWIKPFGEKQFVQYFMPYREVGMVKNATKEAAVGLEKEENGITVKVHFTASYPAATIIISKEGITLFSETVVGSPALPYERQIGVTFETGIRVEVKHKGQLLVAYEEEALQERELPPAAVAALKPADIQHNEQLFLTGQHIEQYRHATYSATDYYEEALRRDAGDIRCNNAMGLWYLRRAKPSIAGPYLHKAIATATYRNPNPYDGEMHYNLGWCLLLQGKKDAATDAFYKAAWDDAWQHTAYLQLARLACGRGDWEEAAELAEQSLYRNWNSHTVRHLKAVILRKQGKDANAWIGSSLEVDPFNYGCHFELYLSGAQESRETLLTLSRNNFHNILEYALDYAHAGLNAEAEHLLLLHTEHTATVSPLCFYYLAWLASDKEQAMAYAAKGHACSHEYCFPHRIEDALVLEYVLSISPNAKAWYYLGNLWYDKKQFADAIHCWRSAIEAGAGFATVYRNLSLAMYNKEHQPQEAVKLMEKAFSLDPQDARVLMEIDLLYKKRNDPPAQRRQHMEAHLPLVQWRDDLYLEYVTLHNQQGQYEAAAALLAAKKFHPWEGGEGKVTGQYLVSHTSLARQYLQARQPLKALQSLDKAAYYPENLGEGKLYGAQENDIFYLRGLAYEQLQEEQHAIQNWQQATKGISEPVQAIFYNDPQPDKIFYQGLAWLKLGRTDTASAIFEKLMTFGAKHAADHIEIDYFAVSLPELLVFDADLDQKNRVHCMYMQALGLLGHAFAGKPGYAAQAEKMLAAVVKEDVNHLGALVHWEMWKQLGAV